LCSWCSWRNHLGTIHRHCRPMHRLRILSWTTENLWWNCLGTPWAKIGIFGYSVRLVLYLWYIYPGLC
jgi:hypothetical protein